MDLLKIGKKKPKEKRVKTAQLLDEQIRERIKELERYPVGCEEFEKGAKGIAGLTEGFNKYEEIKIKKACAVGEVILNAGSMLLDVASKAALIDFEVNGGFFGSLMEKSIAKKEIRPKNIKIHP